MDEGTCDYWIVMMLGTMNIWRGVNGTILEESIRIPTNHPSGPRQLGILSLGNCFGFSCAYKYIQG